MQGITYTDYLAADHHIFPLHRIINGACDCGRPECAAVGKHPVMTNWQYATTWDDEQLALLEDEAGLFGYNQLADGFGVNLATRGLLVVDIDARNGGAQAAERLASILMACGYVVATGSGGGSKHYYFSLPEAWRGKSLRSHVDGYAGIDFKSTGFVVGAGSQHKSGNRYTAIIGTPSDIGDAPAALLELLAVPDRQRSTVDGRVFEYSVADLDNIVMAIKNTERDYERWIRVGMGIHHATAGQGYALWHQWSAQCDAHDDTDMPLKWGSFGRSAATVTAGTLLTWARADGYVDPVTFDDKTEWELPTVPETTAGIDLLTPPGLVGQLVQWINSRSLYPRKHLAVAAALQIVGNAAGLRYRVGPTRAALNLITLGVAGSGSGKGAILDCVAECHRAIGIAQATHGGIKSEQEILRNAVRHQGIYYTIDEVGTLLSKISGAKKSGGRTPYLESVTAAIMGLFSAVNSIYAITGDLKEDMRDAIKNELAKVQKQLDERGGDKLEERVQALIRQRDSMVSGLKNPFLSFFGVAEPGQFADAVNGDKWLLTGGFLGRALIFEEPDSMPRRRPLDTVNHDPLPAGLAMALAALYGDGHATMSADNRVELHGEIKTITLTGDAAAEFDRVYEYWHARGCKERDDGTGLESLAVRATELTLKVAGVLGAAEMLVTLEHMRWAHALVKKINGLKISKARALEASESNDKAERSAGLLEAIASVLQHSDYQTVGVIANKYRTRYTKSQIQEGLDYLVAQGAIVRQEVKDPGGRLRTRYSTKQ
jgi:hypothetical protein